MATTRASKRQKLGQHQHCIQTLNNDRFSQLPDSVLLHIFTFLPILNVVKGVTRVSKRLASLKTSLLSFVFRRSEMPSSPNNVKMMNFIDETLIMQNSYDIERFCIEFGYVPSPVIRKLDNWVRFAMNRKVKEVELFFSEYVYKLPKSLFRTSNGEVVLTRLSLRRVGLENLGHDVKLRFLKSLSIKEITLDDIVLDNLLCCSPILEYLELVNISGMNNLNIVSTTLKELKLRNSIFRVLTSGKIMRISAPSLQLMDICGYFYYQHYTIESFSTLLAANLRYTRFCKLRMKKKFGRWPDDTESDSEDDTDDEKDWWLDKIWREDPYPEVNEIDVVNEIEYYQQIQMATNFIRSVQHVMDLSLGTWSLKVLSMENLPYLFSNCKHVTLAMNFMQWELPAIASLLNSCPKLESLTVDSSSTWSTRCNGITNDDKGKRFWASNPSYEHFSCLQHHLKTVKILGLVPHKGGVLVTEFLRFLMKYARVLERLSIGGDSKLKHKATEVVDDQQGKETFFQLSLFHMVSSFPRSSSLAVIEVTSSDGTKTCNSENTL